MLKRFVLSLVMLLSVLGVSAKASQVEVYVNVSEQSMTVNVGGGEWAYWPVSTARTGYYTPRGSFRVQRMARVYYSRKYDNAPMPNALFFKGGYAIHGSNYIRNLGRPASHGCIRLHPSNAAALYALVQKHGAGAVHIRVSN